MFISTSETNLLQADLIQNAHFTPAQPAVEDQPARPAELVLHTQAAAFTVKGEAAETSWAEMQALRPIRRRNPRVRVVTENRPAAQ